MLDNLLGNVDTSLTLLGFVRNIALGAVLALLLERVYTRYGHSLSNRQVFARHFFLLAMTTTLIITVVQSSLALSLGLIGALSIVRFRSAIKEPEELTYIFLAISIGLGMGANQPLITVIAFLTIVGIVWIRHVLSAGYAGAGTNLFLNVTTHAPRQVTVPALTHLVEAHCARFRVKRVDTTESVLDASFLIEVDSIESIQALDSKLRDLDSEIETTIIDYRTDAGTV